MTSCALWGILAPMTTTTPLEQLTNYYPISPLILTAGQPTAEQIVLVGQAGCDVVINLARPSSPNALADEAALAAAQGMEYIAIPVVWEEPTLDDLARFFAVMDANRARKVFVHCVVGAQGLRPLRGELPGLQLRLPLPRAAVGRVPRRRHLGSAVDLGARRDVVGLHCGSPRSLHPITHLSHAKTPRTPREPNLLCALCAFA